MVQEQYAFGRDHTSNSEFGSFPGLSIGSSILSYDAGQWQWAPAPIWPLDREDKQLKYL